jgi:hypothetical protein
VRLGSVGFFPAQPRPVSNLLLSIDNVPVTSRAFATSSKRIRMRKPPRGFERCLQIGYVWMRWHRTDRRVRKRDKLKASSGGEARRGRAARDPGDAHGDR